MSLDLHRTLREAVDAGDDARLDVDLGSITARVRRRRHVRAGVRAGVGVAAAGAVALAVPHLAAPQRDDQGLPAARPDAPVGTCGSQISGYAHPEPATVGLAPSADGTDPLVTKLPAEGGDLGTYVGPSFAVQVAERLDDAGTAIATAEGAGLRLFVTHGGTVVAADAQGPTTQRPQSANRTTGLAGTVVSQSLAACSSEPGVDATALPAGTYDIYVGYDPHGAVTPTAVAGPWRLTVVRPGDVTGLPAGFPHDLPLVGGRVVQASSTATGGWIVELALDADDLGTAAGYLLSPVAIAPSVVTSGPGGEHVDATQPVSVQLADGSEWTVRVDESTADGTPSVVYEVAPGIDSLAGDS